MRITVTTVRSGQPRPYADTIHVVRVGFERVPWDGKEFVPWEVEEAYVTQVLGGLGCGFTLTRRQDAEFLGSYLVYLTPVVESEGQWHPPHADVKKCADWEFMVVHPYTD